MRNLDYVAINAVDSTTNPVSNPIDASQLYGFSVTVFGPGTLAGALKVQVSNDPAVGGLAPASPNWIDLPSGSVTLASGKGALPFIQASYNWIRLVYTNNVGTGNVTAQINAKGF